MREDGGGRREEGGGRREEGEDEVLTQHLEVRMEQRRWAHCHEPRRPDVSVDRRLADAVGVLYLLDLVHLAAVLSSLDQGVHHATNFKNQKILDDVIDSKAL